MIIQVNPTIFACKIGESTSDRYTIVTTQSRNFHSVEGTACIYESSMSELLKVYLSSDYGYKLAESLDIDAQRISRMRGALDVGFEDGGNRRKMEFDDSPDLTGRLKVIGEAPKQIIFVSAGIDTWQIVPSTQVILQPTVKPHLKRWLQNATVDDAAAKLDIGKRQVTEIKRLLGILRR